MAGRVRLDHQRSRLLLGRAEIGEGGGAAETDLANQMLFGSSARARIRRIDLCMYGAFAIRIEQEMPDKGVPAKSARDTAAQLPRRALASPTAAAK